MNSHKGPGAKNALSHRLGLVMLLWVVASAGVWVGMVLAGRVNWVLPVAVTLGFAAAGFLLVYRPLRRVEDLVGDLRAQQEKNAGAYPGAERVDTPLGQAIADISQQNSRRHSAEVLEKQVELDSLQSQINPHFLYNTLESIRGEALNQGAAKIAEMTEALSTFFRYSVSRKEAVVSLQDELKNVRDYFTIQQFRFNNRFKLDILVDEPGVLAACMLPKLTLQPVVENAIFHGLEGKMGEGCITIRTVCSRQNTLIIVSDDGLGMREEVLRRLQDNIEGGRAVTGKKRGTGIALPNVHRRIRLTYGDAYGLGVNSMVGMGTDVEIMLPAFGTGGEAQREK